MYIYGLIRNSKRYKDKTLYDSNGMGNHYWHSMVWDVLRTYENILWIMLFVVAVLAGIIFGLLFHSLLAWIISTVVAADLLMIITTIIGKYSEIPDEQREGCNDQRQ